MLRSTIHLILSSVARLYPSPEALRILVDKRHRASLCHIVDRWSGPSISIIEGQPLGTTEIYIIDIKFSHWTICLTEQCLHLTNEIDLFRLRSLPMSSVALRVAKQFGLELFCRHEAVDSPILNRSGFHLMISVPSTANCSWKLCYYLVVSFQKIYV